VNADEQSQLLDNLQNLLEQQIELARKGNYNTIEALAKQAGPSVEKIAKIKSFGRPEFDNRRKHLLELYKKLELMLVAEKTSVKKQQKQVDNVRKILNAYRNSG